MTTAPAIGQQIIAPLQSLIGGRILALRGQRVILDVDLAELYGVQTAIGQAQPGALSARLHVSAVGR